MTIEDKIKELILSRYRSIREFTQAIDMPYSTFDTILKRGIENSNVTNVIKICKALAISADALAAGEIIPSAFVNQSAKSTDLNMILSDTKNKILTYDNLTLHGSPIGALERVMVVNAIEVSVEVALKLSKRDDLITNYRYLFTEKP